MGEAKRRELALEGGGGVTGRDLKAGSPDDSPAATSPLARKKIVSVAADPDRQCLVLKARGPLDIADTEIELPYLQLEHLGAQYMLESVEARIALAGGYVHRKAK